MQFHTIRVELGSYVLQARQVDNVEITQAVGDHARCVFTFDRDPRATGPLAALRLGDLADAKVRVIVSSTDDAGAGGECLTFEGQVRHADATYQPTGIARFTVVALSASYALAEHVDRSYRRDHTVAQLVTALGATPAGALPDGEPRDYIQPGQSAWAELAEVAAGEGLQLRPTWPRSPEGGAAPAPAEVGAGFGDVTHTLVWGRDLLGFSTSLVPANAGVTSAFYDPAEKHAHQFVVRATPRWLGGAAPVVSAAQRVADADADGGDPGHVEVGGPGGIRARTLAEFRTRLERESARRIGATVKSSGASTVPGLRAGDKVDLWASAAAAAGTLGDDDAGANGDGGDGAGGDDGAPPSPGLWVNGPEDADRTGLFGLVSVTHRWNNGLYENQFTATPWADYAPAPADVAPESAAAATPLTEGGLALAIVVANADPKNRGRVKVRYAWMDEGTETAWIRVSAPGAGNGRGFGWLPTIGDEVVVAAVAGDPEHPVVLGSLWNGVDQAAHFPGRTHLVTPSGNTLALIEGKAGANEEIVEVHTPTGKTGVQLAAHGGSPVVTVYSAGDISLEAPQGQVRITAKTMLAHVADTHETQVGGAHTLKVQGAITVESAARVAIKAAGDYVVTAGGTVRTHAGGVHTLTGSAVTANPPGASPPRVTAAVGALAPSLWGPRAVPTPGPGVVTKDPRSATKRELAAAAAQTASAAVGGGAPAPPSRIRQAFNRTLNPMAQMKEYEQLEAARQSGTLAEKVSRRAERAALVAKGQARAAELPGAAGTELAAASQRLKQFSHDIELARLSRDVYRMPGDPGQAPLGWTRLSDDLTQLPPVLQDPALWRDDASGFAAGLYQSAPELGGETVLAYRGTANGPGWVTDADQAVGLKTAQYDKTIELARLVKNDFGPDVLATGHSLGGGEASTAAVTTGLRAATFNPSGPNPATVARFGKTLSAARNLVTSYHVPGELLSAIQSPLGRLALSPFANVFKAGRLLYRSIRSRQLPDLSEAKPTLVPPVVGRQVLLPTVAAAEVPLLTSGIRHMSIFPIQGMEQQKDQDRATIEAQTGGAPGS